MLEGKYAVLIAEDSEEDLFFVKRAIILYGPRLQIVGEVEDGAEVIAYLSGQGQYADRQQHPFPDLVLLDWKMPRIDAFGVLEWLRTQSFPNLKAAVMAGDVGERDRKRIHDSGFQYFYGKTSNPEEMGRMVRMLEADLAGSQTKN